MRKLLTAGKRIKEGKAVISTQVEPDLYGRRILAISAKVENGNTYTIQTREFDATGRPMISIFTKDGKEGFDVMIFTDVELEAIAKITARAWEFRKRAIKEEKNEKSKN